MNYTHPLKQQYNKKVGLVLQNFHDTQITVNNLVILLSENQIKFFSPDDVAKVTKLCSPFDKLNLRQAFTYLQLIYVHVLLQIKYFIVKFSGRSYKTLNIKPLEPKKIGHQIELCIGDLKRKMIKLFGKDRFWYKALGGVSGSNFIKKQIFYKKICKILANTPHCYCSLSVTKFFFQDELYDTIQWENIYQKMNFENSKLNSSVCYVNDDQILNQENNQQQKQIKEYSKNKSKEKEKEKEKGFRITSILSNQSKKKLISLSQSEQVNDSHFSKNNQLSLKRKRLKTLQQRPKIAAQSWNLALTFEDDKIEDSIHSKNRYNVRNSHKKCQTSLNNYPQA